LGLGHFKNTERCLLYELVVYELAVFIVFLLLVFFLVLACAQEMLNACMQGSQSAEKMGSGHFCVGSGQWAVAVAIKVQEFRSMYRNAARRPRPAGFRASALRAFGCRQSLSGFAAI
jgi:hypothetical protein